MDNDIRISNIEQRDVLFGPASVHVPVTLHRLKRCRMIWFNSKSALKYVNPQWKPDEDKDIEKYVLNTCSFILPEGDPEKYQAAERVVVYADRYGGGGIGNNGGSGRAAVIDQFHVKGIGATPLVSELTDFSHATGGAYLEEAVREVIFTEICRAEFPHSAVPILAIIDTGIDQVWNMGASTKTERRVLVVRPLFLRPAHYMRAQAFLSGDPKEGFVDSGRVSAMIRHSISEFGCDKFISVINDLGKKWARQLAYSFAHRNLHGSLTPSNITLNGELLDFGAMSAVPSWSNIATTLAYGAFTHLFEQIKGNIHLLFYFLQRHKEEHHEFDLDLTTALESASDFFKQCVSVEILRIFGIERPRAEEIIRSRPAEIWHAVKILIDFFQQEKLDYAYEVTEPIEPLDIMAMWDDNVPPHMATLRDIFRDMGVDGNSVKMRNRTHVLSLPRSHLYRENMKEKLFNTIDHSGRGTFPDRKNITKTIYDYIVKGRRDTKIFVPNTSVRGFAINEQFSLVIFDDGDGIFAIDEDAIKNEETTFQRIAISRENDNTLRIDNSEKIFQGASRFF